MGNDQPINSSEPNGVENYFQKNLGTITFFGVVLQFFAYIAVLGSGNKTLINILNSSLVFSFLFILFNFLKKKISSNYLKYIKIALLIILIIMLFCPTTDWHIKTFYFGENYVINLRTKIPIYEMTKQIMSPTNTSSVTSTVTLTQTASVTPTPTLTNTPTITFTPTSTFTPTYTNTPSPTPTSNWELTNGCITEKWSLWPNIEASQTTVQPNGCKDFAYYSFKSTKNSGLKIDVKDINEKQNYGIALLLLGKNSIKLRLHINEIFSSDTENLTSLLIGFVDRETNYYIGHYIQFQSLGFGYNTNVYSNENLKPGSRKLLGKITNTGQEVTISCSFSFTDDHLNNDLYCSIFGLDRTVHDLQLIPPSGSESLFIGYEVSKNGRLSVIINELQIKNDY